MGTITTQQVLSKYKIELPGKADDKYGGTRRVLEGYHLDQNNQIGEGAYGTVFTGYCRETKKKVALKRIRTETEKEGFPITAIREIKILTSMQDDNIVNLREIVRSDISDEGPSKGSDRSGDKKEDHNPKGAVYMVFDYAEFDLTGLMDSQKYKFTEPQVKCIFKQLLRGLAYIHGNGVLHRDLKASNILITKDGIVKLADFGLARTYKESKDVRLTNRVITLWYRPPELLLGADKYGPAVDMWSVGCILVELLLGKAIFPGKDEVDQLDKIFEILGTPTEEVWPGVSQLPDWKSVVQGKYKQNNLRQWLKDMAAKTKAPPVPEGAIDLLEQLLSLDPSKRPGSIEAFQHKWLREMHPPACLPQDLPVNMGSGHEYTMKKKHEQLRQQAGGVPHQGGGGGRGQQQHHGGGGGSHPAHYGPGYPDAKRHKYPPPAGGVSGGYGGPGSSGGPSRGGGPHPGGGYQGRNGPAPSHSSMPPPQNRTHYNTYQQPPPQRMHTGPPPPGPHGGPPGQHRGGPPHQGPPGGRMAPPGAGGPPGARGGPPPSQQRGHQQGQFRPPAPHPGQQYPPRR